VVASIATYIRVVKSIDSVDDKHSDLANSIADALTSRDHLDCLFALFHFPPHIVAIQLKIFIPVGTAIIMVAAVK
jgi:hypothetical protein